MENPIGLAKLDHNKENMALQGDPRIAIHIKNSSRGRQEMQPFEMPLKSSTNLTDRHKRKKMKKSIFVSYSPNAGFTERKFILETVKQFKDNNLAEDIWFDKDERNTDSPCWFSSRMEAVERCRAAVVFISDSYFKCPVSLYESKTLLERQKDDPLSVHVYIVLYSVPQNEHVPKTFQNVYTSGTVDLVRSGNSHRLSLAEKTSMVVGTFMEDLERLASIHTAAAPTNPPDTEFTGEYVKKKICNWTASDLQEWLFKLGVKEFYRQSFAENMVDGFLLMSMTDEDMVNHMAIDSRVVRRKIMQQIVTSLDREHKLPSNWHLRARNQRPRSTCLYVVYDPADVRLAQTLKQDLLKKGIQVVHHQKLGQSKEEFLQLNCGTLSSATHLLVLLTEHATSSPFVYNEVLFGDWLGKKVITAMFKSVWGAMRSSLRAVLGDYPSIDFASQMYGESLDVLEHHIKPLRAVSGVVLEQSYLNKMADGIRPLVAVAGGDGGGASDDVVPSVFISYQWDMQSRVEELTRILQVNGVSCWADVSATLAAQVRGHSSVSTRSLQSMDGAHETLQSQIQRNMKAANVVLCCITSKYMQSDNCIKDLTLAETFHKAIVPVMLRFCPWPPEGAPSPVRKILARHAPVDLSNDKLFKQNLPTLLDRIKKIFVGPIKY